MFAVFRADPSAQGLPQAQPAPPLHDTATPCSPAAPPQDKEDALINPLMSFVDLGHALAVLGLRAGGGCGGYPVAALQRQLAAGYLFVAGWISAVLKNRRLGRTANRPVRARVYFPIHHDAIECHVRGRGGEGGGREGDIPVQRARVYGNVSLSLSLSLPCGAEVH